MIRREVELIKNHSFFLFGPRQTGKSTLLTSLFSPKTTHTYNLLNTTQYSLFSADPSRFREEVKSRPSQISHIVIDEIQKIPALLDEVHLLMESPHPPYFVMTGSSARRLKRSHANLLGGRALTYHLAPLTFRELGERFSLLKVLQIGSLPGIYLEEDPNLAREKLQSYVDTYLKEEIELEAQVRQIGQFIQFLTLAGFENGNILNFSNIARETGTSYQTVKSYFLILVDTLLGQFLFPYLKSIRKRTSKHPKFYFFDPGVTRALTKKLSVPLELHTPDFGRAFEHFIILEVMRFASYHRLDLTFSYYRVASGAEVDLIIETPRGNTLAIEIKGTDRIDSSHLKGLKSFAEVSPQAELCCVSLVPHQTTLGGIKVLPWQNLFEWISTK